MDNTNGVIQNLKTTCPDNMAAKPLEYIQHLSLASNHLTDISSSLLSPMRMLQELDLRNNFMINLPTPILESADSEYALVCEDDAPYPNGTYPWWSYESGCAVVC